MKTFDELEARLKPNRTSALAKMSTRVLSLEKMRLWFVGLAGLGAFLAAIAKAVTGTPGTVMVFVGATLAGVGAFFVARFDYRKLELMALLTEAEEVAEDAIAKGRELEDQRQELAVATDLLDRRRLAFRQATDLTREAVEQAALAEVVALPAAAKFMLDSAVVPIGVSIGFETDELWAISIFQVQGQGKRQILRRIAGIRADRLAEQAQAREWHRNEGLVGVAWHNGRDAIIEDYRQPQVAQDYPVPAEQERPHDAQRYRSMAAIPIIVGPAETTWGVVAASSDLVGRFRRDPGNNRVQAVDTVRSIARSCALLAAVFHLRG